MPLSPHEIEILDRLEEDLRVDDPTTAAAASAPPRLFAPGSALLVRHALGLFAVLISLVVASTVFAEQLGALGLGVLTCLTVVPWLIGATRSAERRQRTTEPTREITSADQDERGARETVQPPPAARATLHLAAALALVALALIAPGWSGVVPLVLTFVLLSGLPRLAERVVEWVERRGR